MAGLSRCDTQPSSCPIAQIVRQDRSMEQIVFPVPGICQFLTEETKHRLFTTTEQDEQGSKVSDFFDQSSFLHNEMEWQRKLRSETGLNVAGAGLGKYGRPCQLWVGPVKYERVLGIRGGAKY